MTNQKIKTSQDVEYDTENTRRVLELLERSFRGMTITEIAKELGLNRHTVTKILDRLLIEKRVDYDERGPAKVFYSTGKAKFVARIDQGEYDKLWIDIFKPKYPGEEEFIRINQTKHDVLIRSSSKFKSIGSVAIKRSKLREVIEVLKKIEEEFSSQNKQ